jgi:hypothetical protein
VYTVTDRSKKRKTADKKAAVAKAAEAAASVDPSEPWAVHNRQPWADKEVKPAELNDEQKAFLEQVSSWQTLRCSLAQAKSAHSFSASTWPSAVES